MDIYKTPDIDLFKTMDLIYPSKIKEYLETNGYNYKDCMSEYKQYGIELKAKNKKTKSTKSAKQNFKEDAQRILEQPKNFTSVNFDTTNEPPPTFKYKKEWSEITEIQDEEQPAEIEEEDDEQPAEIEEEDDEQPAEINEITEEQQINFIEPQPIEPNDTEFLPQEVINNEQNDYYSKYIEEAERIANKDIEIARYIEIIKGLKITIAEKDNEIAKANNKSANSKKINIEPFEVLKLNNIEYKIRIKYNIVLESNNRYITGDIPLLTNNFELNSGMTSFSDDTPNIPAEKLTTEVITTIVNNIPTEQIVIINPTEGYNIVICDNTIQIANRDFQIVSKDTNRTILKIVD
jgi:hypothetical protein